MRNDTVGLDEINLMLDHGSAGVHRIDLGCEPNGAGLEVDRNFALSGGSGGTSDNARTKLSGIRRTSARMGPSYLAVRGNRSDREQFPRLGGTFAAVRPTLHERRRPFEQRSEAMNLDGMSAVVTGGSRGLGRGIVEALSQRKARIVAVGRDPMHLQALAREVGGVTVVAADASDEIAAARIQDDARPDVLVLCAGAAPVLRPLHLHTWETFSQNWNVDTKMAFTWVRDALLRPMRPGSHIVIVSSGAALKGSPISGGYAGAKRTQWFIADYAAKEIERLGLGIHVHCLLPQLNPSTDLGRAAVAAYAARAGIEVAEFEKRFSPPVTPAIMGQAVVDMVEEPSKWSALAYEVSGKGLSAVA